MYGARPKDFEKAVGASQVGELHQRVQNLKEPSLIRRA